MFADCIKSQVHPATWAVVGIKKTVLGGQIAHRGTAFAVDFEGHLLTCWHVTYMDNACTEECDEYLVTQPDKGPAQFPATLVAKEKDRDVALLKIGGTVATKPLRLFHGAVPWGQSCSAFGHPLSMTDAATMSMRIFTRASAGVVSMPYTAARFPGGRPIALYELDLFSHGGSSGGPVFLRNGDVFGLVSGGVLVDDLTGVKAKSNLTVAIDVREAIEFLQPHKINLKVRRGA